MDTEQNYFGDQDDLDDIIERQGDIEAENDDDEPRGGDDEAIEAPAPKKKDEKADEAKKKRPPQPKLDPARLAGPRGLLALEAETRDLKLRGRGHELQDLELVLGRLQHWAHRLFPKYTFEDCLTKLENLGRKKNVGVQIKKIRMGLTSVDDLHDVTIRGDDYAPEDDDDRPAPRLVDPDAAFNDLMANARPPQASQPVPPAAVSQPQQPGTVELTEEQKARILRNRLAAEERRLARLKAQKEQELREQEEAAAVEAMADME